MIEQKLIVDRFIDLNIPATAMAYAPGAFVTVPVQSCYIQESHGVFKKTSDVALAPGPKAHRNFRWLPWLSGAISEVPTGGVDVVTGPMSGCWLVMYRRAGVTYVGHLGTDVARPVETGLVKASWNGFALAHPGDVLCGFNPFGSWAGAYPAQKTGDGPPRFFGLLTATQQLYSVFTYQQNNPTTKIRIAGIQLVPTAGLGTLQAL
jgi:hypothetical protein